MKEGRTERRKEGYQGGRMSRKEGRKKGGKGG